MTEQDKKEKEELIGMYHELPFIDLGKYKISMFTNKNNETVWIQHESGEGAQFSTDKLEQVIDEFYKKWF